MAFKKYDANGKVIKDKENSTMTVEKLDGYTDTDIQIDEPESAVKLVNGEQKFVIDFAKVGQYPLIEKGTYLARLSNLQIKQGANGPYLNAEWTIADEGSEFLNAKAWQIMSFSPKSLWVMKNFLKACNIPEDRISNFEFDKAATGKIMNPEFDDVLCNITIDHQQDSRAGAKEGDMQVRIVRVSSAEDVAPSF